MRVHFIAIGGAVMHNLAIALKNKGYNISGSDDEIFEPSRSRLDKYGLLPSKWGWDTANITREIDTVILGMHAKADNPELLEARNLGIKIMSFPEYLYDQTKN
ncbi:MAG TPA: Mur ligase domain-containing protein, partial [Bacteroidales bacterium]|nr:Mur ligase domain-containing protein [Bacteroidales bacterium]